LLKKIDLKFHEIKIHQIRNIVEFIIFCSGEDLEEIANKYKIHFIIGLNFRAGSSASINLVLKNAVVVTHENLKIGDNFTIYKLIEEKIDDIDYFILYKSF
jgi:hypothetical protein